METFSEFNKRFYNQVKDVSVFDCEEFNMLKVVLDGLRVNYTSKGKVRAILFYPYFLLEIYYFLKKIHFLLFKKKSTIKEEFKTSDKSILFFDVKRFVKDEDGQLHSLYFYNIRSFFSRSDYVTIAEDVPANYSDFDLSLLQIREEFELCHLNRKERLLRVKIIETYNKILETKWFTEHELKNIRFAFSSFFHLYKVSNRMLRLFPNAKTSYIICHYHKEGTILALKRNNIECVELQHGLIAEQDVFYVFPENICHTTKDMLFPSKILVYGKYWKDLLLKGYEFKSDQISIIGYYHSHDFHNKIKPDFDFESNRKVLLITTQTSMHTHYINYINWLADDFQMRKIEDYIIVVKPHPSEDVNIYLNAFKKSTIVKVTELSIELLFQCAFIHLSVYSTTLFDALRYDIQSFSLKVAGFEDYVDGIIKLGIAQKIEVNQNPIDFINFTNDIQNREYFYSKFDAEKL